MHATRTVLVQLVLSSQRDRHAAHEALEEFSFLAQSAGAEVCARLAGTRARPDPGLFIGRGKVDELKSLIAAHEAELVLINHDLSPIQQRNLENALNCRVLDRTGLILDIFALRARSAEGRLQVELAQLERLATRLVRGWTHLERQKGGIGLRGPGETQLETDRRLMRERIKSLKKRLERVSRQRGLRRRTRKKVPVPTISLVGYTNAGKSSLFNRLTGASVHAADQLFATLDPTMRRLEIEGNTAVILADTVGFIRDLPHGLVEAFKSTLEEVAEADLLIHVVDQANPEAASLMVEVDKVLEEIGADRVPMITVFNKIDLSHEAARIETGRHGPRVWLSAHSGEGLSLLTQAIAEHVHKARRPMSLHLPPVAGRLRASIFERLDVVDDRVSGEGGWDMALSLDAREREWLLRHNDFREEYLVL